MELISVFEPRDKAAILEDNLKKKFSQNLREKRVKLPTEEKTFVLGNQHGFHDVYRCWEPAKARQFLVFQTLFFLSLSVDARSPGKHDAAASGRKRLLQTRVWTA